jgi:hypothetical protein
MITPEDIAIVVGEVIDDHFVQAWHRIAPILCELGATPDELAAARRRHATSALEFRCEVLMCFRAWLPHAFSEPRIH